MDRSLHEVRTNPRRSGSWLRDAVVFGFRELKGKVGVGVGEGWRTIHSNIYSAAIRVLRLLLGNDSI